ncbi:hypothetical protein, partial [Salmonella enterica]|uniref:hypothetical protein n=1 Tax=Salmonella enterica TaxID=28901 RepID=UPI001F1FBE8C
MLKGLQRAQWADQACPEYIEYFIPRMHVRVSPDDMEVDDALDPKNMSDAAVSNTKLRLFMSINYIFLSINLI